ncbi:MAG: endonuclease/exonuclease/phosphatase family protein, partial [Halochromatium sp.]
MADGADAAGPAPRALDPLPHRARTAASVRIVVTTYNIHRAVGGDRRCDPLRIAETIAALDADIVALQEVETPARSEPLLLLRRLSEHGYRALLGHTMRRGPHHYGNLLLTRFPISGHRLLDLSQPGCEPRGLIDARLVLGAEPASPILRCLATHLGLRARERQRQIARITTALDDPLPAGLAPDPVPELAPELAPDGASVPAPELAPDLA